MAGDKGYNTPTGKIVVKGEVADVQNKTVETATNVYPGRLLQQGTNESDVVVHDGTEPPIGWAGFEDVAPGFANEAITDIYTVADDITVYRGGSFVIMAKLAAGPTALQGDDVFSWADGEVVTGALINGTPHVRVAFSKNASHVDTNLDVPAETIIGLPLIEVTTAVGSSHIDVGMGMAESGYDPDGLLDGTVTTATGFVTEQRIDADAANLYAGALLVESDSKDATATPLYWSVVKRPGLVCDGTLVSLEYTTSNHAVAGYIWLPVSGPGIKRVGTCVEAKSGADAAADMFVLNALGN